MPMDLGGGSNTDGTDIGDSRYATDAQPRSAPRNLSPTFSLLPALPLTMSYRSPSQVDAALLSGLDDIRRGDAIPRSSSPSSSHGSVVLSSDSDDLDSPVTILLLSTHATGNDCRPLRKRVSLFCTKVEEGTISSDSTALACLS